MKTVEQIHKALQDVGLDGWKVEDRADNYVKLIPPTWSSITYQMLAQVELALETDRIDLGREDSTPGHRISSVTFESGEPGYIYLDVYDK
jgi:hypothetical protein